MEDWELMVQLLISTEQPMDEKTGLKRKTLGQTQNCDMLTDEPQLVLLHLMSAACQRAALQMPDQITDRKSKKLSQSELERQNEWRCSMTAGLINQIGKLISIYSTSPSFLRVLIGIPRLFTDDAHVSFRQKKELTDLLKSVEKCFATHVDEAVLKEAAATLKHYIDLSHCKEEAESTLSEITTHLSTALDEVCQCDESMEDSEVNNKYSILSTILTRILSLSSLHIVEFSWDRHHDLEHLLQRLTADHSTRNKENVVIQLIQLNFIDISWQYALVDQKSPSASEMLHAKSDVHALLSRLEFLIGNSASPKVKDAVFSTFSDLFVLCNGKLHGTLLHDLTITPARLTFLQSHYNRYFKSLMESVDLQERIDLDKQLSSDRPNEYSHIEESDEEHSERLASQTRRFACYCASKVVSFDHNSRIGIDANVPSTIRHQTLTAMLISYYAQFEECNDIIKATQSHLKAISLNTLLMAQYYALRYAYETNKSIDAAKELAARLVLLNPIDPETRSFLGFFKAAVTYATHDAPAHLHFLDVLAPYVTRASGNDINAVITFHRDASTIALEAMNTSHPSDHDEDWEPLKVFAEMLRKRSEQLRAKRGVPPVPEVATPASAFVPPSPNLSPIPRMSMASATTQLSRAPSSRSRLEAVSEVESAPRGGKKRKVNEEKEEKKESSEQDEKTNEQEQKEDEAEQSEEQGDEENQPPQDQQNIQPVKNTAAEEPKARTRTRTQALEISEDEQDNVEMALSD